MSEFIAKQVEAKAKAWHAAKALLDSAEGRALTGEEEAKLTQVSLNYKRIFEAYSGLLLTLDGTQTEADLQKTIIEFMANHF